jgi:hypothetical protein
MVAVDICNLALSYLGDMATVASIDPPEGSAQAQHCARFYPVALNLLLESHRWNFITKRAYLAVVEKCYFDTWQFAYALPSDATNVTSVLPKALYPVDYFRDALANYWGEIWPFDFERNWQYDFQIETLNGQQVILSNVCDAVGRYTVSTVQPGMFPALFTDALVWKLASMLAGPLLKGDAGAAESKRCLGMYQMVMEQAKGRDANQRHGSEQLAPSSIRARG